MVLVKIFVLGILIYFSITGIFFLSELTKNQLKREDEQEKNHEKLVRKSYLKTNEFIRQFIKDLKEENSNVASELLPPVLAHQLFEAVGKKFSVYEEVEQMYFSKVNVGSGFYEFSFRVISGNLEQDASLLEDTTAETVKDFFWACGSIIADADVMIKKSSSNVGRVIVRCANNEATYASLQAFKQRQANISARKKVDLVSDAVDEELERDLRGL